MLRTLGMTPEARVIVLSRHPPAVLNTLCAVVCGTRLVPLGVRKLQLNHVRMPALD